MNPADLVRLKTLYPHCDELIEKTCRWAESPGHFICFLDSPEYPPLLKEISRPPEVLYIRGNPKYLKDPQIAIVGSRQMSAYGRRNTQAFAHFLSQSGLTITSGLALGVDACAHEATLKAGGATIAVLATGIDLCYPKGHERLLEQITEQGAVISECPLGTPPLKTGFPRRNRIISGLSIGTLVIEAAIQSGSLLTARSALEQNREVFAIPGSIHHTLSKGCHALLKMGAKCVESGSDILEECRALLTEHLAGHSILKVSEINPQNLLDNLLNPQGPFKNLTPLTPLNPAEPHDKCAALDPDYRRLLQAVGTETTQVETLLQITHINPNEAASMLLMLELDGWIEQVHGGYIRKYERS